MSCEPCSYDFRERNHRAVYLHFDKDVDSNVAQVLIEKFSDASSVSFGRGFIIHCKDEATAEEIKEKAAEMTFAGIKPIWVNNAYDRLDSVDSQKRSMADGEGAPSKKLKVGNAKQEDNEEEEDEEEQQTTTKGKKGPAAAAEEDDDDEEEDEYEEEEEDDDE